MPQLTADEIPELLARLVDKSLVQVDADGRFDLLQLVRSFGQEELMRSEDNASTRDRHLTFYRDLCVEQGAEMSGPDQLHAIEIFGHEFDNIRTAVEWASAHAHLWNLAPDMIGELFLFVHRIGTYEGGFTMTKAVIDAAPPGSDFGLASALAWLAVFQQFRNDPQAEQTCHDAFDLGKRSGNEIAVARALFQNANICWYQKRFQEGDALAEEALTVTRQAEAERLEGTILATMGNAALFTGRLDRAKDLYKQSEDLHTRLGNMRGLAVVQGNLGHVHERLGEYEAAYRIEREALRAFYALEDRRNLAGTMGGVASGFYLAKEYETAAILLGRAQALWDEVETYPDDVDAQTAERWRERLLAQMGQDAFCTAFEKGRVASVKEMVELVLDRPEPWNTRKA